MVLYSWAGEANDIDGKWQTWTVDKPGPLLQASKMTFVADGPELELLLTAIRQATKERRGY